MQTSDAAAGQGHHAPKQIVVMEEAYAASAWMRRSLGTSRESYQRLGQGEPAVSDTLVLDVDGTLVDTNYHHAIAWYRAFRGAGVTPALWRIHRAIGMGGDKLVAAVGGEDLEGKHGDDLRDAWTQEYGKLISEVQPFEGATRLLQDARDRGLRVVLASSGQKEHVEHYLDLLDARQLAHDWTTSEDAEETKPAPDLVQTALAKVGATSAVMVGDSTWDAAAAERAEIPSVAVLTGGFSRDELRDAGARAVYDSLVALNDDLDTVLSF
ncbi:MAG: HAD family hydrolase [Nocardioidaceae bacterium]